MKRTHWQIGFLAALWMCVMLLSACGAAQASQPSVEEDPAPSTQETTAQEDTQSQEEPTLESLLGPNGELSDIQQAFIDETAVQCGFCTPGFIMTAVEILESGKLYTDEELRKLLSGHLCRCTGYENILRAVKKTMYRRLGLPYPAKETE